MPVLAYFSRFLFLVFGNSKYWGANDGDLGAVRLCPQRGPGQRPWSGGLGQSLSKAGSFLLCRP